MSIKYTINVKGANGSFNVDGVLSIDDPLETEVQRHGTTGEYLDASYKVNENLRIKIAETQCIIWQNNVDVWAGRNKSENPVLEITYQSHPSNGQSFLPASRSRCKWDNSDLLIFMILGRMRSKNLLNCLGKCHQI